MTVQSQVEHDADNLTVLRLSHNEALRLLSQVANALVGYRSRSQSPADLRIKIVRLPDGRSAALDIEGVA